MVARATGASDLSWIDVLSKIFDGVVGVGRLFLTEFVGCSVNAAVLFENRKLMRIRRAFRLKMHRCAVMAALNNMRAAAPSTLATVCCHFVFVLGS